MRSGAALMPPTGIVRELLNHGADPLAKVLDHSIVYYTILYYTILYYTILYYTVLYYTVLSYTTLYYTVLHYTTLYTASESLPPAIDGHGGPLATYCMQLAPYCVASSSPLQGPFRVGSRQRCAGSAYGMPLKMRTPPVSERKPRTCDSRVE